MCALLQLKIVEFSSSICTTGLKINGSVKKTALRFAAGDDGLYMHVGNP